MFLQDPYTHNHTSTCFIIHIFINYFIQLNSSYQNIR